MRALLILLAIVGYFSCIGIAVELIKSENVILGLLIVISPGLLLLSVMITEYVIQGVMNGSKKNTRNNDPL